MTRLRITILLITLASRITSFPPQSRPVYLSELDRKIQTIQHFYDHTLRTIKPESTSGEATEARALFPRYLSAYKRLIKDLATRTLVRMRTISSPVTKEKYRNRIITLSALNKQLDNLHTDLMTFPDHLESITAIDTLLNTLCTEYHKKNCFSTPHSLRNHTRECSEYVTNTIQIFETKKETYKNYWHLVELFNHHINLLKAQQDELYDYDDILTEYINKRDEQDNSIQEAADGACYYGNDSPVDLSDICE